MSKELAKTYDPKGLEDRLYQKWLDKGYFHATVNPNKKPFTIMMPPPNVTGQLHICLLYTSITIRIRHLPGKRQRRGRHSMWNGSSRKKKFWNCTSIPSISGMATMD